METNSNAVEGNAPSKSSGSIIQIDSIYIELPQAPVQVRQPGNCHENFCLREYALEKRRTNPDGSVLFPLDDTNVSVEQLPPMEVPKFRLWSCTDCIREIENPSAIVPREAQEGAAVSAENIQALDANANTVEDSAALARMDGNTQETSEPVEDTAGTTRDIIDVEDREDPPSDRANIPAQQVTGDANVNTPGEVHESADRGVCETININVAEFESEHSWDSEDSSGMPCRKVRKVRLLKDLLTEHGSLRCRTREAELLESSSPGNAGSEGQTNPSKDNHSSARVPPKKIKPVGEEDERSGPTSVAANTKAPKKTKPVGEEDERSGPTSVAANTKAPRRDTGKAIMTVEARADSEEEVNVSGGEGLFIGTTRERSRHRHCTVPALSRQNSKQSEVLDCGTIPPLPGHLQASSDAVSCGDVQSAEQREHNDVNLISGAFNPRPYLNSTAEAELDLSLSSFPKKTVNQSSESAGKGGMLFGKPLRLNQPDGSQRQGPQFDLNERAANKEVDFLQLGLDGKNSRVPGHLSGSDQKADDIPMDIVELLAKQQYERRNGDAGTSSGPSGARVTSNAARGFLGVNEIWTVKQLAKEFSDLPSFRGINSPSGITMAGNYSGASKGYSTSFADMGRNNLKMFQEGRTPLNSFFTDFAQNQQKINGAVQVPATASIRPDLQRSEHVDPFSLSRRMNVPFGIGFRPKLPTEQHRGRTISDIKADELKRTEEARVMFSKLGGTSFSSTPRGSLDPYANEHVPAMQLLSLMDGRPSGAAVSLDSSKFPDKPFAPCSSHPRFSTNERQDAPNQSFFLSPNHMTSGLGVSYSDICQSSRPLSAILPRQISFRPPVQDESKEKSHVSGFGPSSSRAKGKRKASPHSSDSSLHPQKHRRLEDSRSFNLEGSGITGGVGRANGVPSEGLCGWNRNPADFSLPVAGNEYTICTRDLKPRKRNSSRNKPSSSNASGAKRQRKAKPGTDHE